MKILSLRLRNFKGIKSFTLEPKGSNIAIYGDNATGKTTLFDAFTWLLFDKDSNDRANFEIKTLKADGRPVHGLEHKVEAELKTNGRGIALCKVFKEKWTKKRGSATKEFTGHTTDYFINGVPVKKKEYDDKIAEVAEDNVFKLLTSPTYFNEVLHWQERRKILLEVCGDISDQDVIAYSPSLSDLSSILGDRTLEEYRKIIAAIKTKINKQLEQIPVRISEVEKNLPDVADGDGQSIKTELVKARAARQVKAEELARVKQGGGIAQKEESLAKIRSELMDMEMVARRKNEAAVYEKRRVLQDAQIAASGAKRTVQRLGEDIAKCEAEAERLVDRIGQLRQDWYKVDAEKFEYNTSDVCPTCGQALPAEQVEVAREKAQKQFNLTKARRLEQINEDGKALAARLKEVGAVIEQAKAEISKAEKEEKKATALIVKLQTEIKKMEGQQTEISRTSEYAKLARQRDSLSHEIDDFKQGNLASVVKIQEQLDGLDNMITGFEKETALIEQYKQGLKRIAELKTEERQLAAEYERLEKELYLTEEFIRTKVRLLEDRINSKFKLAKFKLFNVLINGAVEECCETLYEGVPYSGGLNNGMRINVGLDIINTLNDHYGFAPPIFIDNAEAVTRLLPTEGQQIQLVVSEKDKALRVEIENELDELPRTLFKEVV